MKYDFFSFKNTKQKKILLFNILYYNNLKDELTSRKCRVAIFTLPENSMKKYKMILLAFVRIESRCSQLINSCLVSYFLILYATEKNKRNINMIYLYSIEKVSKQNF